MSETPPTTPHRLPVCRRRWTSLMMGLLLLVCGGIIGSSVTVAVLFDRLMTTIHEPEKIPPRIVGRMRWSLGLNDDQSAKIESIYQDLQQDLVRIRDQNLPEILRKVDEARNAVTDVLSAEQAEEYNRNFDRLRETLVPKTPTKPE